MCYFFRIWNVLLYRKLSCLIYDVLCGSSFMPLAHFADSICSSSIEACPKDAYPCLYVVSVRCLNNIASCEYMFNVFLEQDECDNV